MNLLEPQINIARRDFVSSRRADYIQLNNNAATFTLYIPEFERIKRENNDIFLNLSNGRGFAIAKLRLLWFRIIRQCGHEAVTQH